MAEALSVNWADGLLDLQPSVQVEIELSRWLLAAVRIYCVRLFRRSRCLPAQDLRLGSEQRHPKLDSGRSHVSSYPEAWRARGDVRFSLDKLIDCNRSRCMGLLWLSTGLSLVSQGVTLS
ncbi:hypothetical protein CTRI78_v003554 [Colletotrichum trifolii]|uniref:Uncharacterized protein n=1 Tax=Colletotrichum trifolii TaxID=5466 RepID=A0A4R8RMR6_COLTR|nr:hypothetical protein CTRI78_v003554 [Colletotrichum trifolii]